MQPRIVLVVRCVAAVLFALPAVAPLPAQAPGKKPLVIEDLYRVDHPTEASLSHDGQKLVFIRRWVDAATKRERSSLWLIEGDAQKARPLEQGEPDARAPLFSPDGKWIAFLSTRPRPEGWKQTPPVPPESEAATDVWLLPVAGGASMPLGPPDKPYGRVFNDGFYGRLAFTPDSRRLVFVADDGVDPRTPEEIAADVLIVRPDQGEGYTGYGAAQIWVAHLPATPEKFAASKIDRLTRDDVWYGDPQWAADGKSIVVHANRTDDRESVRFSINKNFDLWSIDVETNKIRQLTTGPGPEVSPRLSPDGKRLVCLSCPRKGSHRDLFNVALVTNGVTEILFDHHGPQADKAPHPSPAFPLPVECWEDDGHIHYQANVGVETRSIVLDLKSGKGEVDKGNARLGTDSIAGRAALRKSLLPAGNAYLQERRLGNVRVVRWQNDGHELEGVLTLPPDDVAQAPYKMVLFPHGGPHSRSTRAFNFTAQIFAAHGYAVFEPNFRGSEGYGQKFIDADRHDLGGGDMRDMLSGVDQLIKDRLVNPDKQFVYGVSYGGFTTCWLVGHTKRFKAAVAQNAVTELNVMWGLSDLQSWTEWEFGGRPWEVPAAMHKHSPLTYVASVQTPTLILHSREDRRCPMPMGRMFYQGLLARQVPTQMVIYPGEGHGIRQPRHREDVLRRTLAWFAKYE